MSQVSEMLENNTLMEGREVLGLEIISIVASVAAQLKRCVCLKHLENSTSMEGREVCETQPAALTLVTLICFLGSL